jgi:hypothetical protein
MEYAIGTRIRINREISGSEKQTYWEVIGCADYALYP